MTATAQPTEAPTRRRTRRLRNLRMPVRYEDDLRMLPTRWSRFGVGLWVAFILAVPLWHPDFFVNKTVWNGLWVTTGVLAIGAVGLNLLTGFTGQVSLGHAFFIGAGAFMAAQFGAQAGLPLILWLPLCAVVGGLLGALIGPFALRLRGNYLVIITFGLVILGQHIFRNWTSATGGVDGRNFEAPVQLLPGVDFESLSILGRDFTRNEGYVYLVWGVLGLTILLVKNLLRTRPGRAFQAVRDRDRAAEVIGVSLSRYKVGAFAISSAIAATAGGLHGAHAEFAHYTEYNIFLSIEYVAVIIIGGLGTIMGAVIGAVFFKFMPEVVDWLIHQWRPWFVQDPSNPLGAGSVTVSQLETILQGLVIVLFLVFEPKGLAAIWRRIKTYFLTWPFRY